MYLGLKLFYNIYMSEEKNPELDIPRDASDHLRKSFLRRNLAPLAGMATVVTLGASAFLLTRDGGAESEQPATTEQANESDQKPNVGLPELTTAHPGARFITDAFNHDDITARLLVLFNKPDYNLDLFTFAIKCRGDVEQSLPEVSRTYFDLDTLDLNQRNSYRPLTRNKRT